ncbi:MAG: hypothetical protein NTW87_12175, partial [Planctomycetota bacterium]|nr:hypothetical protein [Planctomycetota bacterium]
MDGLLVLLGVGILLLLLLGFVAAIWLVVRFISRIFQPSTPTPPPRPVASSLKALPFATGPGAAKPQRAEALDVVKREVNIAFANGRISKAAYMEMCRYITAEREALDSHAQPAPAPGAVPAAAPPALPLTPPAEAEPMRKPEQIRAAIARLHADAQAPSPARPTPSAPASAEPARGAALSTAGGAAVPPVRPPLAPARPSASGGEGFEPRPKPEPQKPLAERLFTPENVRILQSVGICIIFISAVAFVRTQMWEHVSAIAKMGIMLAGTAACIGIGYVLRRWTQLRITALGLLILGQLSLLLDAHAALIKPGAAALAGASLYPYSPASLWTLCFIVFSAAAVWHARTLEEPLFDAFTFFGGLAAWGSAAMWCGVDFWLMPAAFVPAAFVVALVSNWLRAGAEMARPSPSPVAGNTGPLLAVAAESPTALQRWSLPWWLDSAWQIGAVLLALALPSAALLSGQTHLHEHYYVHAAAIVALAAALLTSAWRERRGLHLHAAAILLLFSLPLAAYAFDWRLPEWSVAFAVPGALLAVVGLVCARFAEERAAPLAAATSETPLLGELLANWGLTSALLGLGWAFWAYTWQAELNFS